MTELIRITNQFWVMSQMSWWWLHQFELVSGGCTNISKLTCNGVKSDRHLLERGSPLDLTAEYGTWAVIICKKYNWDNHSNNYTNTISFMGVR